MFDGLIKNARIVNEGNVFEWEYPDTPGKDTIPSSDPERQSQENAKETIDAGGKFVIPGVIDDQVHFREPGLTHKAEIYTESRAAVAGGITSFMEMPNTVPQTITLDSTGRKIQPGLSEDPWPIIASTWGRPMTTWMKSGNLIRINPAVLRSLWELQPGTCWLMMIVHLKGSSPKVRS